MKRNILKPYILSNTYTVSIYLSIYIYMDLYGHICWHSSKETSCQCGRHRRCGFDPGLGRTLGVGNDNPLQYSCLENSMDGGSWQATFLGAAESRRPTELAHTHRPFWSLTLGVKLPTLTRFIFQKVQDKGNSNRVLPLLLSGLSLNQRLAKYNPVPKSNCCLFYK